MLPRVLKGLNRRNCYKSCLAFRMGATFGIVRFYQNVLPESHAHHLRTSPATADAGQSTFFSEVPIGLSPEIKPGGTHVRFNSLLTAWITQSLMVIIVGNYTPATSSLTSP